MGEHCVKKESYQLFFEKGVGTCARTKLNTQLIERLMNKDIFNLENYGYILNDTYVMKNSLYFSTDGVIVKQSSFLLPLYFVVFLPCYMRSVIREIVD